MIYGKHSCNLKKKNNFLFFILFLFCFSACAGGSKRPDFREYRSLNVQNTIWRFCEDNTTDLCEYDCKKWIEKGTICKNNEIIVVKRIALKKAKEMEMVIMSKEMLLNLIIEN